MLRLNFNVIFPFLCYDSLSNSKIEHFGYNARNSLNNRALENKYAMVFSTDRIVHFRPVEGSPSRIS